MDYKRAMKHLVACLLLASACHGQESTVQSPNGKVSAEFNLTEGQPRWALSYDGRRVLNSAPVGLELDDPYQGGFALLGTDTASNDTTWKPVWGRSSVVRDHYNETIYLLQEQEGKKRSKVDVVVEDFNFISDGSRGGDRSSSSSSDSAPVKKTSSPPKKSSDDVVIEDIDDEPVDLSDIPF